MKFGKNSTKLIILCVLLVALILGLLIFFTSRNSNNPISGNTPTPVNPGSPSSSEGQNTSSPTDVITPTPEVTPEITPTQESTIDPVPVNSDNKARSWYYMPATSLGTDTPAYTDKDMVEQMRKYNGIWQQDTTEKVVYITMDTGEDCRTNLNAIMEAAKSRNVPITFFLTGTFIKSFPETVQKMTDEGHIIANHTWNHPNLSKYLDENGEEAFWKQITDVEEEYKKVTGKDMLKILRPPEGVYSEKILTMTYNRGYRLGFWSFAYMDWDSNKQPDQTATLNKILAQVHPGQVLLLHPKSATNTAIFGEMVDRMKERGYTFKGLDAFPEYK